MPSFVARAIAGLVLALVLVILSGCAAEQGDEQAIKQKLEQLEEAVEDKDAFGLVEVTGKKLEDAVAPAKGARGTLEVLEAEIYEPLNTAAR